MVVLDPFRATVSSTGRAVATAFAHVCDPEDGRITRFQNHADTAVCHRALEA